MTGVEFAPLAARLWQFAADELADARRVAEKLVTLGGRPAAEVGAVSFADMRPAEVVDRLIELEHEAIEALQDVIPTTGHTGESEALEHRLEHLIMRKQEQVDTLVRVRR
jgi:bacterioferritin (cytochrome b1)